MNAQEKWKDAYREWVRVTRYGPYDECAYDAIDAMYKFRREAALERIIARQARRIDALQAESNRWYDEWCKQVEKYE